jgi:hypothetical protein
VAGRCLTTSARVESLACLGEKLIAGRVALQNYQCEHVHDRSNASWAIASTMFVCWYAKALANLHRPLFLSALSCCCRLSNNMVPSRKVWTSRGECVLPCVHCKIIWMVWGGLQVRRCCTWGRAGWDECCCLVRALHYSETTRQESSPVSFHLQTIQCAGMSVPTSGRASSGDHNLENKSMCLVQRNVCVYLPIS